MTVYGRLLIAFAALLGSGATRVRAARFLFDASHAQSAANADWVVDADVRNLNWKTNGTFSLDGNESNAQRFPTPPACGVGFGTPETYWSGALSAWAVDLVKRGHRVETLPAGETITYATTNSQDLSNYDVVVAVEPNTWFTLDEKQALLNFVADGGGLFMIANHSGSDRNNDGADPIAIWNDFLTNNGLTNNPFGIVFPLDNFSGVSQAASRRIIADDPIIFGPAGAVTNVRYFNGNRFVVNVNANPTLLSHVWFGLTPDDATNHCAVASVRYGKGRVVAYGDSSAPDDGTGDPNDINLFNGYTDSTAQHRAMLLNASEWLAAGPDLEPGGDDDGDGLPNGWENSFGLNPLNPADAGMDSDGDGLTNLEEFGAGTEPGKASSSAIQFTAVSVENDDVRVTWTAPAGRTNVLQAALGTATGGYSDNFTTIGPAMVAAGSGLTSTNYLDLGAATNGNARFYRLKMSVFQAADDAADPAYSGGWTNGSNGGRGFGPWMLTATAPFNSNTNGFFVGPSVFNAFGASPGIDVADKSWGIYANSGALATAYRSFANGPLLVGQSFLLDFDNGLIQFGSSVGFCLRHGAASDPCDYSVGTRLQFLYIGHDPIDSYKVVDAAGLRNIGVPFTGTGLRLAFRLDTADSYTLMVINDVSGTTNIVTGVLATSGSLDSGAFFNRNAGAGSTADLFFNSFRIVSP